MSAARRFAGRTRLHCTSMGVGPSDLVMLAAMKSEPMLNSGSGFEARKNCARDAGGPIRRAASRHPSAGLASLQESDIGRGYWQRPSQARRGYWANLLRQLHSALASRRGRSARNATFSVGSNPQRTIHSALASGFALSSKGRVRLGLLPPSGVALRAEGIARGESWVDVARNLAQ